MDTILIDAVKSLVDEGMTTRRAFEVVGLDKTQWRTYQRIKEKQSAERKNKKFERCKPWRCPECGHLLKIKSCLKCGIYNG